MQMAHRRNSKKWRIDETAHSLQMQTTQQLLNIFGMCDQMNWKLLYNKNLMKYL